MEGWVMSDLDHILHPRSIAVVGASSDPNNPIGQLWLRCAIDFGFGGELYPVNPKASDIMGLKCYPSIRDIPGPVDYAISLIPRHLVPQLLEDCGAKGVRTVHLFTAGFSETCEEEGIRLEEEVIRIAQNSGVRIIGPNCMGIYCPESGLSFNPNFSKEGGGVGYISQSGGNARKLTESGGIRGLRFSKVISYGNASDLNEADFIEYLAHDPQTKVIAAVRFSAGGSIAVRLFVQRSLALERTRCLLPRALSFDGFLARLDDLGRVGKGSSGCELSIVL